MSMQAQTEIDLQRALETIRQERETFEQRKTHESRWFLLRFVMGWTSVALLAGVMIVSSIILLAIPSYPTAVVILASAALFTDGLGLIAAVWKIVLNPSFVTRLEPVTKSEAFQVATHHPEGSEQDS